MSSRRQLTLVIDDLTTDVERYASTLTLPNHICLIIEALSRDRRDAVRELEKWNARADMKARTVQLRAMPDHPFRFDVTEQE